MRISKQAGLMMLCGLALSMSAPQAKADFPLAFAGEDDVAGGVAEAVDPEPSAEASDYWLGVRCVEIPDVLRAQVDLPKNEGVLVDEVVPDSPAEKAGLKAFDVIFAVDGTPVGEPQQLAAMVAKAGKKEMKIDYLRAGKRESLTAQPATRPEFIAPQQQDQRAIRQWVERLGQGPAPMRFRFFHPGMVLPPGASLSPRLPDGMTVTIEKQGDKPARVMAKRGDKTWEASEDALDKLPPEARDFAARMLGFGAFAPGQDWGHMPPPAMPPHGFHQHGHDPDMNRRLDDMSRQIDGLRRALEELRRGK